MRRKTIKLIIAGMMLAALTSCGVKEDSMAELDAEYLSKVMQGIEYETATVNTGTLVEQITEDHMMVVPRNIREFKLNFEGIINEYYFKPRKIINKGDLIADLDTQKIDKDIMMQQYQVEREKIIYDQMKSKGENEKEIKIQELEVKIQEEKLRKLEKDKEKHKIYAPVDCYITKFRVEKGQKFNKEQTLFIAAYADIPIIKPAAVVNMNNFENINIGDLVKIKPRVGDYEGKVSFISRKTGRETIYISLIDENAMSKSIYEKIRPRAFFNPKELKNKLIIPKPAVKRNGTQRYVEVLKEGVKKIRFINVGAEGVDEKGVPCYEVLSGLNDGDVVILKKKSVFDKM